MPTPTQLDPEFLTPAADGLATGTAGIAQRAATAIEDKRDALASGLDSAAAGIQAIADDLPGGAKVVEAADAAAAGMERAAEYVRETDLRGLYSDVREIVKRHPGATLFTVAALGFVLARGLSRR
jgi:hypothetical protein